MIPAITDTKLLKEFVADFVNNISVPAAWFEADSIHLNSQAETLTGYTNDEVTSLPDWFQRISGENWEEFCQDVFTKIKQYRSFTLNDIEVAHKDGSTRFIRISVYSVKAIHLFVINDITIEKEIISSSEIEVRNLSTALLEIKRLQKRLVRENKKLVKSNSELENFAYVASHDLKEPLRKIVAFGDRLQEKYGQSLDEKGAYYIERMSNSSRRMNALIDDLLKYSRVSRNNIVLEPIDMQSLLDEIKDRLENAIEQSNAQVVFGDCLPIVGSKSLVSSLFQNLIHNGIKFKKEGEDSKVHITSKRIKLKSRKYIQYEVTDNGIGIETEYHKKVFEIFEKLHSREKYAGTGIGLSICKRIMEKHNGKIIIKSEVGTGTTFVLQFPDIDKEKWKKK